MNTPQVPLNQEPVEAESEISLLDIIDFFRQSWKFLAIALLCGLILGAVYGVLFPKYKAEQVLTNSGGVDFLTWRSLSQNLPLLAAEALLNKELEGEQLELMTSLANPEFWKKNVFPSYSLSKNELKDLAGVSKELSESGGTSIINFIVGYTTSNQEKAIKQLRSTIRFIREGSSYLTLRALVNVYETKISNLPSILRGKISNAKIELTYLKDRARHLEDLKVRFPANVGGSLSQNVLDPKESGAKFLPIGTQIVAVYSDINNLEEGINRMSQELEMLKVDEEFVNLVLPLLVENKNGLTLIEKLLKINQEMRSKIDPNKIFQLQELSNIESELVSINTSFKHKFDTFIEPTVKKESQLKKVALTGIVFLFLALLYLLGRRFWASVQKNKLSH